MHHSKLEISINRFINEAYKRYLYSIYKEVEVL
jgi:hypothetical protein